MVANHIHDALAQVRELQKHILHKQRFKGYSGSARIISGTSVLLAAALMTSNFYPQTVFAHLYGWAFVIFWCLLLSYGAIIHWFFSDASVERDFRKLKPALDSFPGLFVGGILTLVLIRAGQPQLLFGVWMSLYGLTCLATRHNLPRRSGMVGVYYVLCGAGYLLNSNTSFLNPWPMGIVFFVGEWLGGIILHFDGRFNFTTRMAILRWKTRDNNYVG